MEQPKKVAGGAFGRFLADQRPALQKECAGKPVTEVTKLGSIRFKALDVAGKAKYQKMYEEAQAKYVKDLAAFKAGGGVVTARKSKGKKDKEGKDKKSKKKVKDVNKPKMPAGGGYGCFLNKHRAEFKKECAGQSITAIGKLAGAKWKSLAPADQKPFKDEFVTLMAAYRKKMESYVPPPSAEKSESEKEDDDDKDEEDDDEDEDDDDEEEDDDDDEESAEAPKKRPADKDVGSPSKKAKTSAAASPAKKGRAASPAKKGRAASPAKKGKAAAPASPAKKGKVDVEAEAKKIGWLAKLKALQDNPKVKAKAEDILAALKKHNGSVIATKKQLGA